MYWPLMIDRSFDAWIKVGVKVIVVFHVLPLWIPFYVQSSSRTVAGVSAVLPQAACLMNWQVGQAVV